MVLFCLGVQDIITFVLPGSFFKNYKWLITQKPKEKEQY